MKRFSEQFHTKAASVSLQATEQRQLRERVVSYMEYHPLQDTVEAVSSVRAQAIPSEAFRAFRLPATNLFRASFALTAVILMVVPFIAEKSVPGDSLYAVKVRFNEEVRSTLAFGTYEKIEWETERLNRRVAEARLLASEGRLTNEVEAEIAAAVKEHAENAQEGIETLRADDADQATLAAIELTTTLVMQSSSLQEEGETTLALAVSEVAQENPTQMLVDVINESLNVQAAQPQAADIPGFDKAMARVELNTTRAYELLNSLSLTAEDPLRAALNRRLEDIGRSVTAAQAERGGNEQGASEKLVDVLQRTQKLIVFMSDITANAGISLETAVPVVLTAEEVKQALTDTTVDINRKTEILKTILPQLSPQAAEKITYSIDMVAKNQLTVASSTDDMVALETAKQQIVLLDDALKLAEAEGVNFTSISTEPVEEQATTTEEIIGEEVSEEGS